ISFTADDADVRVMSGEGGTYEAREMTPAAYQVIVSAPGLKSDFETRYVVSGPSTFDINIDTLLARVIVTDSETGVGIEGVSIGAASDDGLAHSTAIGVTDAAGALSFQAVPGRVYRLVAEARGYANATGEMRDATVPLA